MDSDYRDYYQQILFTVSKAAVEQSEKWSAVSSGRPLCAADRQSSLGRRSPQSMPASTGHSGNKAEDHPINRILFSNRQMPTKVIKGTKMVNIRQITRKRRNRRAEEANYLRGTMHTNMKKCSFLANVFTRQLPVISFPPCFSSAFRVIEALTR